MSSVCSLADCRALFSDCYCSLYVITALLTSRLSSLLNYVFWCSLHGVHSILLTFCWWQHATRYFRFVVRCWLLAFASFCSVFVTRCLALVYCCSLKLLAAYYLLNPARYSLLATHGQLSLLSSRLMSSADCCKSLRIDHPCWRCVIRFSTRKYPPHWCSSLAAVCLLFISQHANRLLHLVSRCSQIPVWNILLSAHRTFRPAQFLFFVLFCVTLHSCYSYLTARRLLLPVFF